MSGHQFSVKFLASGRGKAQCPPDSNYPQGVTLNPQVTGPTCFTNLPYPAPECGVWIIYCRLCQTSIAVTAAGRPDDPVGVYVPCKLGEEENKEVKQ